MLKHCKQFLFIALFISAFAVSVKAQSIYNPNVHTATNKPIGLLSGPVDARSYYYDAVNYKYRPYNSTSEVLNYLPTYSRSGNFPIYIKNAGDSVDIWMFRDGTANSDLIKINQGSGSSLTLEQVSQVIHDSLSGYSSPEFDTTSIHNQLVALNNDLDNKVDKVSGKQLSTNDYTTTEKNKLSGIQSGAEQNVNADWNASSGDAQILNKPSIPAQFNPIGGTGISLSGIYPNITFNGFSGVYDDLSGKPSIPTKVSDLTNDLNFAAINDASTSSSSTYSSDKINSLISGAGGGTVLSVGLTTPTGFSVSGSPVTSSGNIALSFASGYSLPTISKQNTWDAKIGPSDTSVFARKTELFSKSYNDLIDKPTIPTIPAKMPLAEAQAGTATTQRTIDAATLNAAIQALTPSGGGTDSAVVTKSPLTKSVSGTRIELGVDTAQLMTTHAFNDSVENKLLIDTTQSGVTYAVKKGYGVTVTGGDNTVLNHDVTVAVDTASATGLASKQFTNNTYAKKGDVPTNNNQLTNGEGYITHNDAASQIADSLANHPGGSADSSTFLTHTQASNTYAPLGDFNTLTAPDGIIKISGTPKVLGTGAVYLDPVYVAVAKPEDTIPKLDTNLGVDNLQNVESASRTYDINGGTLTFEDKTAPVPTRLSLNSTYNFLGTVTDDGLYGTAISQTSDVAANNAVTISASNPGGNTTLKVSRQNGFDFSGGPVSMSQYKNNATGDSVAAFTSTGAIVQKYNYNQPGTTMKFKVEGLNAAAFPYTITADDSYLIITNVSATTGDNTIDVPVPTLDDDGRRIVIKNASDGSVTLSQTIFKYNGAPLDAIVLAPGDVLRIIAWNQTWYQL